MRRAFFFICLFLALFLPASASADLSWHESTAACLADILAAASYPFFSCKEINISVAVILQFVLLISLALLVLRKLRSRTVVLLQQRTRLSAGSAASVAALGYYAAAVLVLLIILNTVGINLTQLTVIFGALGIGIGFGLQAIMNNFISGIILLAEQVIRTGDIVSLESGVTGEVKKIAIRSTVIRTGDGEDVIVPNAEFISGKVKSWTYQDDWRRLKVPFGVAYHADPADIVRIATEAAREVEIIQRPAQRLLFRSLPQAQGSRG